MVPILSGRIQTRLFLLTVVGGVVTLVLAPVLPVDGQLTERYQAAFVVLGAVAVIGLGWELVYHLGMQWRWEKDWPTLFGLLTAIPEGLLIGTLSSRELLPGLPGPVPVSAFVIHFTVVWLTVWLTGNGPMRVLFVRWRFQGGRLV